jgi:hypothetical protein
MDLVPRFLEYYNASLDSIKGGSGCAMRAADRFLKRLCPARFITGAKFGYAYYIWRDVDKYRMRPLSCVEFCMAYITMGTPREVPRAA